MTTYAPVSVRGSGPCQIATTEHFLGPAVAVDADTRSWSVPHFKR